MIIVLGAGWPGRTSLGIFLTWTPRPKVSPFTSVWGRVCGLPSVPLGPACSGGEGRRLASAACVDLLHRRRLIPAVETVTPLAKPTKVALGELSMRALDATMCVAHKFEVVRQAKVASVVCLGDIDPVLCRPVNFSPNLKPRPDLHLRGGVGFLLPRLIPPAACCRGGCCQCLAAGCRGSRYGTL